MQPWRRQQQNVDRTRTQAVVKEHHSRFLYAEQQHPAKTVTINEQRKQESKQPCRQQRRYRLPTGVHLDRCRRRHHAKSQNRSRLNAWSMHEPLPLHLLLFVQHSGLHSQEVRRQLLPAAHNVIQKPVLQQPHNSALLCGRKA